MGGVLAVTGSMPGGRGGAGVPPAADASIGSGAGGGGGGGGMPIDGIGGAGGGTDDEILARGAFPTGLDGDIVRLSLPGGGGGGGGMTAAEDVTLPGLKGSGACGTAAGKMYSVTEVSLEGGGVGTELRPGGGGGGAPLRLGGAGARCCLWNDGEGAGSTNFGDGAPCSSKGVFGGRGGGAGLEFAALDDSRGLDGSDGGLRSCANLPASANGGGARNFKPDGPGGGEDSLSEGLAGRRPLSGPLLLAGGRAGGGPRFEFTLLPVI